MADRGRLFYASDGLLWEVDPTASISGEPAQADLQPVRMGEMAAEVMELDQQADDGTDRVFIRGSDGAIKAEVFFDGTNTVINPLTGSVDVQGALATESAAIGPGVSGATEIETLGSNAHRVASDTFSLADDASETLITAHASGAPAFLILYNTSDNASAIITFMGAGSGQTIQESFGSWALSDTDTNNCVFRDGSNNLVLKNRTGGTKSYRVLIDYIDV